MIINHSSLFLGPTPTYGYIMTSRHVKLIILLSLHSLEQILTYLWFSSAWKFSSV